MIKLTVEEQSSSFSYFVVEGHSTMGKKGNNILCAGVSSLIQTILLGLLQVMELDLDITKRDGFIDCQFPDHITPQDREGINLLIMTMITAYQDLMKQYPDEMEIVWID